ncbi:hypothetical protein NBRC10513v2_006203 [Rhodotorula toruloides]|uniref:BY PROTMAP: gi/472583873/gb/EMS21489.1/ MFS phosphate transporter [Rhodosporidium toruloides NP11] gi/647403641/emb/CDR49730.1/ RHTO0S31e00298g1_1 [Rhodosporidium toruloides] n=1 Tax=Rhodotorula toruloides TaxID=5286 RepID=A0A0K3CQ86_RHOTO|nr:Major facilitator superfamily domain-containing protein [Rhodotorula toruloides]
MSVNPDDTVQEYKERQAHDYDGTASPDSGSTFDPRSATEEELLREALFPSDSYTADGRYWADLPSGEKWSFASGQFSRETRRDFSYVWNMFKKDPVQPFRAYFNKYVLTGMGLFVEGYVLFSIGNLKSLFQSAWPACWKTHAVCNKNWTSAVSYLEIVGILMGQSIVGFEGDWIGRKFGLCQDALVMLIGAILLTSVWGVTLNGWVIAYAWSLFIYGFGVGGEYPMTGTRALETKVYGPEGTRDDRLHRGRNVVGSFLMQGWGQVFNQCILLICLMIFHSGDTNPPFSPKTAQATYRVQFGLGILLHLWLFYHRLYQVHDADNLLTTSKRKHNVSGYDGHSLRLLTSHYWGRLFATAGSWFANDVFFYGTKVFAGTFIHIIKPGASLVVTWEYNLINLAVSLTGYYMAFFFIDHKLYGRRRMQLVGFAFDFIIYLFGAIFFHQLQVPGAPIAAFQFMYHFSSFWNQFGPNTVTFLTAAEVYPSSIRSTAHGFSAACGKIGALIPTVLFNYIDDRTKLWFAFPFGVLGVVCSFFFLPDTTGMDLREIERYWRYVRAGKANQYHGIAVHPHHLSWYERVVLKRHLAYDPVQDRLDRIDELRVLYESSLIAETDPTAQDVNHASITPAVAEYFRREAPASQRRHNQLDKERAIRGEGVQSEKVYGSRLEETLGQQ